jgi:hypothetical protein
MSTELWTVKEISAFLKRSVRHTRDRIVKSSGFPTEVLIPSPNGGRSNPLWYADDVLNWVKKHQSKRRNDE